MNEYQNVLKHALKRDIITTFLFVAGIFVVAFLLFRLIKLNVFSKWTLLVLLVGVVLLVVGLIKPINTYSDMQNESYIVYHGNYYQRHQGYKDTYYQTTLLDGDKKINLLSHFTLTQNTGEYYGYVVYGSKSKIVVFVGECLPNELQYLNK